MLVALLRNYLKRSRGRDVREGAMGSLQGYLTIMRKRRQPLRIVASNAIAIENPKLESVKVVFLFPSFLVFTVF